MAGVVFKNVVKKFGDVTVVNNLNFEINDREFVVIVGPSGCGKSTTLRMVAGLESITDGTIQIGDRIVNDLPAKDRDIAMVFQNYALYPHMNVAKNLEFSLKLRKFPKDEIERRVHRTAKILNIEELLDRKPKQLSGGQRQRVAVGRAIVREPSVFLFDEPLSNLDAKLRVQMRSEIRKLHKRLKATMIYVTHDQIEAMTMGDRVVILKDGVLQQEGPPLHIYRRPENKFIAGFIGSPAMNFIPCQISEHKGLLRLSNTDFRLTLPDAVRKKFRFDSCREVVFGIRPEDLWIRNTGSQQETGEIRGKVDLVETTGSESLVHVRFGDNLFIARVTSDLEVEMDEFIAFSFNLEKMHLFSGETGRTLWAS